MSYKLQVTSYKLRVTSDNRASRDNRDKSPLTRVTLFCSSAFLLFCSSAFLLFCSSAFLPLSAQQVQLKGVVTVQNSKTYTGNTQFVKNAEVEHVNQNNAKAKDITGDDGKFTLNIKGAGANTQTQITVTPFGEFADYVVVNEKELKDITLGRVTPVSVFVCKKGELEKRQAEMVGINMRKLEEKMEADKKRLQKELDAIRANNDYLNVRYSQIKDSLDIISKNIDNAFERIKEYAKTMTLENLDDRDENYVKAYACFSRGALDSVSYYLKEHDLDLKYQKIVQLQQEAKKEKELAAVLTESAKAKDEFTENSLNELIKEWLLLARTANLQNDYEKTMLYYEKVIQADSLNMGVLYEYTKYLEKIRDYQKAENYLHKGMKISRELAADNPKFLSDLANFLGILTVVQTKKYEFSEALTNCEEALAIRRVLAEEDPKTHLGNLAVSLCNLAAIFEYKKDYGNAYDIFDEALKIHRLYVAEDSAYLAEVALSLRNLAVIHYHNREFSEASSKLEEAITLRKNHVVETQRDNLYHLAIALYSLATIHYSQNEYNKASQLYEEALIINRKIAQENPRAHLYDLAYTLDASANTDRLLKAFSKALEKSEEALKIYKEYAAENPDTYLIDVAWAVNNLALINKDMEEYSKALSNFKEALEIRRTLAAKDPSIYLYDLAWTLNGIAQLYTDLKEYEQALKNHEEVFEIRKRFAEENPGAYLADLITSLVNMGEVYFLKKEYLLALEKCNEAMIYVRELKKVNPDNYDIFLAYVFSCFGKNLSKIGEYLEALEKYEEASKIFSTYAVIEPDFYLVEVSDMKTNISECYLWMKQNAQAELYARQALEIIKENQGAKINLAHALLFQNKFSDAESIYSELNEKNIQRIFDDFDELEQAGAIPEERKADVEKIREMLKK